MIDWKADRRNYVPDADAPAFEPIPDGDYRVRIADVQETCTKEKGEPMIKLTLEVSGHKGKLFYWLVFSNDNPDMTNQKLYSLWDSFGIQEDNLFVESWVGKIGAALVVNEPSKKTGRVMSNIARFHSRAKQAELGLATTPASASMPPI